LQAKIPCSSVEVPERLRPKRVGVTKIRNGFGFPDVLVEGRAARLLRRDQASPVEQPSSLAGYEGAGNPISLEDDEAD
jgi:hypothetical protein